MQQWEYFWVEVDETLRGWSDSKGDTGEFPNTSSQALLTELGAQGWELAGVASGQSPNQYRLFFKRPKEVGWVSAPP